MFGNLGKMIGQMSQMKQKIADMEKELREMVIKGSSKDNLVQVQVNGKMELQNVTVDEGATNLSRQELEDHIFNATSKALEQAAGIAKEKLKEATGGIDIPGLT